MSNTRRTACCLKHKEQPALGLEIDLDLYETLIRVLAGFTPSREELRGTWLNLRIFKDQVARLRTEELLLSSDDRTFHHVRRSPDGRQIDVSTLRPDGSSLATPRLAARSDQPGRRARDRARSTAHAPVAPDHVRQQAADAAQQRTPDRPGAGQPDRAAREPTVSWVSPPGTRGGGNLAEGGSREDPPTHTGEIHGREAGPRVGARGTQYRQADGRFVWLASGHSRGCARRQGPVWRSYALSSEWSSKTSPSTWRRWLWHFWRRTRRRTPRAETCRHQCPRRCVCGTPTPMRTTCDASSPTPERCRDQPSSITYGV